MADRRSGEDRRSSGMIGDIAAALPNATRFLERIGFPAVVALLMMGLMVWSVKLGVSAINGNTAALKTISASVEQNSAAVKTNTEVLKVLKRVLK